MTTRFCSNFRSTAPGFHRTQQQNQGYDLPPPESVGTQFVAKEYAKIGHSKGRYLATKKASLSYTTRFSPENLLSVGPTKTKSGAMVL